MVKVKLTKTELKAQTDALKRFQRFLPMLQLKKQQLQAEIAAIVAKAEAVAARERELRAAMNAWIGVVATEDGLLSGLVKVGEVKTGRANIAGAAGPRRRGSTTRSRRRRRSSRSAPSAPSSRSSAASSPRSCSRPRSA